MSNLNTHWIRVSPLFARISNVPFLVLPVIWLAVAFTPATLMADSPASRPNVLIIVADDLGYSDVGFHGGKDIPTPHLDSLAAGGARLTNGYVSGPYCSPTRAGLLTGRYQQRFGHEFNPGGDSKGFGLPLTETTIANRFKEAGYATGLVGKWHLGSEPPYHPQRRGFDEFYGFYGGQHTYFDKGRAQIVRGTEKISEPEYLTKAIGREARSFVQKHRDAPFFLYLAFNAVHTPMEAEAETLATFATIDNRARQTYAAMLSAMDTEIGKLLQQLQDSKIDENTLIFFISDNGGPTMKGTTMNASVNAPLRGSKRTTLEGGIRVPFLVHWKGRIEPGTVFNHPVIQLDILPTALAAAGITIDPNWKLDGVDLLPFLSNPKSDTRPHETLYWRLGEQNAIRHGDWKLVQYDRNVEEHPTKGVTSPKLYHLATDIGESSDVAAQNPDKVAELRGLWEVWSHELAEPKWGP